MKKTCPGPKRIFPRRGGAEYFSANNININVDIMFVEQYGKKTCPIDLHFSEQGRGQNTLAQTISMVTSPLRSLNTMGK